MEQIYEAIVSDNMTLSFCLMIVGWFCASAVMLSIPPLARRQVPSGIIALTSNGLATLGVLGTFTGILIGLLDFDITRVDESVPLLLSGLKIAFTTSIVGMTAALLFRVLLAVMPGRPTGDSVTPAHIYGVLQEIKDAQQQVCGRLEDRFQRLGEQLYEGISPESDSGLPAQMRAVRLAIEESEEALIHEFRDFSKNLEENSQTAIVDALGKVVHDFNTNLTEQFGQNFVKLNDAVYALVEWQDRYREHVDSLEARHRSVASSLAQIELSMGMIRTHSERIPQAIEPLGPVLKGMRGNGMKLEAQLAAIADLRDKSVEAFPVIEQNIDKLTTHLETAINTAVSRTEQALQTSAISQEQVQKSLKAYLEGADEARQRFAGELEYALGQMTTRTSDEFARHRELIQTSADEAQKSIAESWTRSNKMIEEVCTRFDARTASGKAE